jgi:serine/threonine-protein kinase
MCQPLQKDFETGYRLDHPHLVRYVSKGDDYLLTEYVDGETLAQFAASHPEYFKSHKQTDRFISQLLDAVGYLHQHQIVHLDLKPDNILITRIGYEVKLTDLGFCYTDTYTVTMGRTDKYAAPEQLPSFGKEGLGVVAKPDARTDIYAIGKIMESLSSDALPENGITGSVPVPPEVCTCRAVSTGASSPPDSRSA